MGTLTGHREAIVLNMCSHMILEKEAADRAANEAINFFMGEIEQKWNIGVTMEHWNKNGTFKMLKNVFHTSLSMGIKIAQALVKFRVRATYLQ